VFHLDEFSLRMSGEIKGMWSILDSQEALHRPGISDIPSIYLHPSLSSGSHPSLSQAKLS